MGTSKPPYVAILLKSGTVELAMGLSHYPEWCFVSLSGKGQFHPDTRESDREHPCDSTIWLFTTLASAAGVWDKATFLRIVLLECTEFSIRDKFAEIFTGIVIKGRRIFLVVDGNMEEYALRDIEMLPTLRKVLNVLAEVPYLLVSFT